MLLNIHTKEKTAAPLPQSLALLIVTVSHEWCTTKMTSATLRKVSFSSENISGVSRLYLLSMMSSLVLGLQRISLLALHLLAPYYGISMQRHMRDVRRPHTGKAQRTHIDMLENACTFALSNSIHPRDWTPEIVFTCTFIRRRQSSRLLRLVLRMNLCPSLTVAKLTTPNYRPR
jgi:hypothetical protein